MSAVSPTKHFFYVLCFHILAVDLIDEDYFFACKEIKPSLIVIKMPCVSKIHKCSYSQDKFNRA